MDPTNSDAAQTPTPAPETPDYSSPNDLSHEMTEAEEAAFVDATLGISSPAPAAAPEVPAPTPAPEVTPEVPAPVAGEEPIPTPPVVPEVPVVPAPEPPKPAPAEEATLQTDDLWIEVEDSEGKAVKLTFDPADPSAFLPDGFQFKDDTQLFKILDAKNEMAGLYKQRETAFNEANEAKAAAETSEKTQQQQLDDWDSEVEALISAGILETPKVKPGQDGWKDDPSAQKIESVFKYMAEQNTKNLAEGKPAIKSFGIAYNLYAHDEQVKADEETARQEIEAKRTRGSLVGGTSSPASGGGDPAAGLYKRGSASNIYQVKIDD